MHHRSLPTRKSIKNKVRKVLYKLAFVTDPLDYWQGSGRIYRGGGQAFSRVIISFGLGPPEVASYMTGTFGEVFGPRNHTGSEPRPARK